MHCFFPLILCFFSWLSDGSLAHAQQYLPSQRAPIDESDNNYKYVNTEDTLSEFKGKSLDEIVKMAREALKDKEYTIAIQTCKALNSLHPSSEYAEWARLKMVEAYYANSEMDNVITAADKFIRLYPISEDLETVSYLKAKAYFYRRDGFLSVLSRIFRFVRIDFSQRVNDLQLQEAAIQFDAFLERFPNGRYTQKVQQKLNELHQIVARKEYNIANAYFKKKAYLASYNRIVELKKRYPNLKERLGEKHDATVEKIYQQSKKELGLD